MLRAVWLLLLLAARLDAAHLIYQKPISTTLASADPAGNIYIYNSSGLTKLDPNGNTLYAKPFSASGDFYSMAADASGNVFLVGVTNSDSLPTTPGVFQPKRSPGVCIAGDKTFQQYPCSDAMIFKIDAAGNLAWASYLGGLSIDQANSVAVDGAGNAYVTGLTQSADFPSVVAFQPKSGGYADVFVTKISGDGTRILYSSFLGASGHDIGHAITVDAAGNAYVAGEVQNDSIDAFVIKVNPTGALVFTKYLTADLSYSTATAIAVDQQGNIYLGGSTTSRSFPSTSGAWNSAGNSFYTAFAAKIAPDGATLLYSAKFPGGSFGVSRIAVDAAGAAYLSGAVDSTQLPIVGPAMQPCPGSAGPYFVIKLNAAGSAPLYSSYDEGSRLLLMQDGSVYLAGLSLRKLTGLEVPGDSFLSPGCVLNGASLVSHTEYGQPGISPGEVVTLKGTGLGPISASTDGTQVLFDGVPAPVIYAQDAQVNVVAPYALAGKSQTAIQVRYQGQATQPLTLPVSPTSAALFTQPDGTPWVINPDGSVNSVARPVARGGTLQVYLTGAGQTSPASVDGQIWQTTGGLQLAVTAEVKNYGSAGIVSANAPVVYAGPVPGLISGIEQAILQIPADLPDSFVTEKFSVGTVIVMTIGSQQLSFYVFIK
jgi:uncharacterized protein (TIGR03437 family)